MSEIDCVCSREGGRQSRTSSEIGFSRQGKVNSRASNTFCNDCFRSSSALNIKSRTKTRGVRRLSSSQFSEYSAASTYSCDSQGCGCARSRRVKGTLYNDKAVATIIAYKNGSKTQCARVVGSTMNDLLDGCTVKLQLLSAARRLFNGDGSEIFSLESIIDCDNVFVSTGEPFQNPNIQAKRFLEASRQSSWTTNGLVWNERLRNNVTKPMKMSARMRRLLGEPKKRFLIFKNGFSTNSVEVVAHLDDIDKVIELGTEKLKLSSKGKVLYDWCGQMVEDLSIVPVLDKCLQTWTSPVIGPMWLSSGEGFSPKGAQNFLIGLSKYIRAQLKSVAEYKHQLTMAKSNEERALVQMSSLLSMSRSQLNIELESANTHAEELKNACDRLKGLIGALKKSVTDEEIAGSQYKLKHIKEMDFNNSLLGDKGLRLKVYRNGDKNSDGLTVYFNIHQARKSVDHSLPNGPQLLRLLIRHCNSIANSRRGADGMTGKILFTEEGTKVEDIKELTYDQKVFLSSGEPWNSLSGSQVLEVKFFSAKMTTSSSPPVNGNVTENVNDKTMVLVKGSLASLSSLMNGLRSPSCWLPASEFCSTKMQSTSESLDTNMSTNDDNDNDINTDKTSQIANEDLLYIPDKNNISLGYFCQIGLNGKVKMPDSKSSEAWIQFKLQSWTFRKDGSIVNKLTRGLLTKTGKKITFTSRIKAENAVNISTQPTYSGFLVTIQSKMSSSSLSSVKDSRLTENLEKDDNVNSKKNLHDSDIIQQWDFTTDGCISPKDQKSLVLTLVDKNIFQVECAIDEEDALLAVTQKFYNKSELKFQRWGIKQEDFHRISQWRHTDVGNVSDWHREGLCWPIKQDGDINENYDWPLQGYFIPFAPPILGLSSSFNTKRHLKLFVLKNGEQCKQSARSLKVPQDNVRKGSKSESRSINQKNDLPSVEQLNFLQFLDHCTSKLNLPSAARRIFNESGNEMFDITGVSDNQYLYISMGEPWSNPNVSAKEKQMMRYKQNSIMSCSKQAKRPGGNFGVMDEEPLLQGNEVNERNHLHQFGEDQNYHGNSCHDNSSNPERSVRPTGRNFKERDDVDVASDPRTSQEFKGHIHEPSSSSSSTSAEQLEVAIEQKDASSLMEPLTNYELIPDIGTCDGKSGEMDDVDLDTKVPDESDQNERNVENESLKCGASGKEYLTQKVPAYLNGDKNQSLKHIYGTTMEQLLQDCTRKFKLSKPAKYLYTENGKLVNHLFLSPNLCFIGLLIIKELKQYTLKCPNR